MNLRLPPFAAPLLAFALALGSAVAPVSGHAAARTADKAGAGQAEILAAQAKQAFKDKNFDEAARLFMKAYAVTKEPALVFNAARAYEEVGKAGDAASLFRLYASIADDLDGIADARARIKKLEAKGEAPSAGDTKAESAKATEPQHPDVKPTEPQHADAKPPDAKPVDPHAVEPKPVAPVAVVGAKPNPAADRALAWVATSGAAVLVGGGAVLAWLGAQKTHDANQLPLHSQADIDAYNTTFDRAQLLTNSGIALVAVGVAAGGAATWLHLRRGATVTAGPDGHGGVWLAGRW